MNFWLRNAAVALATISCAAPLLSAPTQGPVRKLVLEEQRIEGKIRRPQMVLIKADQRPPFEPIVVQSASTQSSVTRGVSESAVEQCPYQQPFRFANKRIVYLAP